MKKLITLLLIALTFASCDPEDTAALITLNSQENRSGMCGAELAKEIEAANNICELVEDEEGLQRCENAFYQMRENNPEVNCIVEIYDELENETYHADVTVEALDEIIAEISSMYE